MVTQQMVEAGAEALVQSTLGQVLNLRAVEARKIAEIVLNAVDEME